MSVCGLIPRPRASSSETAESHAPVSTSAVVGLSLTRTGRLRHWASSPRLQRREAGGVEESSKLLQLRERRRRLRWRGLAVKLGTAAEEEEGRGALCPGSLG